MVSCSAHELSCGQASFEDRNAFLEYELRIFLSGIPAIAALSIPVVQRISVLNHTDHMADTGLSLMKSSTPVIAHN